MVTKINKENPIQRISLLGAAGWFGLYGAIIYIGFHFIMPQLWRIGLNTAESLILTLAVPLALMLVPPAISYQREGRPMSLRAMLTHWRYPKISKYDFAWALFILAIGFPLAGLMGQLNGWLIEQGWITIPSYIPAPFNPLADLSNRATWDAFVSGSIRGNWSLIVLYFILLFFNITGEEILWRGFILPRQEAQLGRWAWVAHGLLWTVFHAFNWWGMLPILPICLIISWTSQHTGRNWSAYIAHYIFNGAGFFIALAFAAGWI